MTVDPCASKAADKFLDYFREAEALHWQEFDGPLPLYKDTSKASVQKVFRRLLASELTGAAYAAELVHLPILAQCLGNANHRTTEMFVWNVLTSAGVRVPHHAGDAKSAQRVADATNRWHVESKTVIGEHDFHRALDESYMPLKKAQHRAGAGRWVPEIVGANQSSVLIMVGPHSLKKFLSC